MSRYQHVLELFLKHTPEVNKARTIEQFNQGNFCKMTEREVDPVIRYMQSLQIHREYLEFFQIGVVRDQKAKIEKVAKYVGLAIRDVNVFPFQDAPIVQDEENKNKKQ